MNIPAIISIGSLMLLVATVIVFAVLSDRKEKKSVAAGRTGKPPPMPEGPERESTPRKTGYFEVEWSMWGDGECSDPECPCPGVTLPKGTGYLRISKELVTFRRDM